MPRAKTTSLWLPLVKELTLVFCLSFSAGVRQPQYSGVGCIYQKGFLPFLCKKAYEL